tara:strand:- start:135 stop:320 length:186 start_codon:yes stop_codon:yes gene_type:complete
MSTTTIETWFEGELVKTEQVQDSPEVDKRKKAQKVIDDVLSEKKVGDVKELVNALVDLGKI